MTADCKESGIRSPKVTAGGCFSSASRFMAAPPGISGRGKGLAAAGERPFEGTVEFRSGAPALGLAVVAAGELGGPVG